MSPSFFARKLLACGLFVVAFPLMAGAQSNYLRQAGEYLVVGNQPGDQVYPQVAIKASGGYVVWQDNVTDGDGTGISARKLDGTLSGYLSTFRVNQNSVGNQARPQVCVLNNGNAAFVWQGGKAGAQHIYCRYISSSGTWVTSDVLVNSSTNYIQSNPALAQLTNGNVVFVWGSYNQQGTNSLQDVYAQRISATGTKVGGEFLINQFTGYNQRTPAIAPLPNGKFIVAWVSEQQRFENSVDIYARLFNGDGTPSGNEFVVNTSTNVCANPSIAASSDGGFKIAWSEKDLTSPRNNSWDVYARAFSSALVGGPVYRLNQYLFGDQYIPKLATLGADVMAVWTSLGQDGSREGIFARFLHNDASPAGDEFLVNSTTAGQQLYPAVAADGQNRFLAVWSSFEGLNSGMDLQAQRYAMSQLPLAAPARPMVTVLSSNSITLSWNPVAGFNVAAYEVYADGAVSPPTAIVTNTWWTMAGLQPSSTHSFQIDYLLTDGRKSPPSPSVSATTYSMLTWGGIPYDWMAAIFGSDVFSWPSPNADSDGDGASNLNEFLAGTDPRDPNSVLRIQMQRSAQGLYLNWNTQPGLIYQVQSSTDLRQWSKLGGLRFAAGTWDSMYLGGPATCYYRVQRVR